ncbi:protein lin-54 homolog [Phlebotomus papatasi]|uniref:protein lin-54 homolog n=1 Tax=Phlebotomus papatasi TaxID=29031 RepID=UPI0024839A54|nr:protein lin-54 homolog [Phlebotomus papatasi]
MDHSDDNEQIEELIYSEEGEELEEETVDILPSDDYEREEDEVSGPQVITGDLPPRKNIVCIKSTGGGQGIPLQLKTIQATKSPAIASQVQKLMGKQVTIVSKPVNSSATPSPIAISASPRMATSTGQLGQKFALQSGSGGKKIVTISPSQAQQFKLVSSGSPSYISRLKTLGSSPGQKIIVKTSPGGSTTSKLSGTFIDMGSGQKQMVVSSPNILNIGASSSQGQSRQMTAVKALNVPNKVQVVRVINPKTQQQTLQKIVIANPQKIKEGQSTTPPSTIPPPKLVIQSKNGQCFYVATSPTKANATKYTLEPKSGSSPGSGQKSGIPVPMSKIVLDKDKLKVVFPEPTILNSSVSNNSKSFPVHVFTSKSTHTPGSNTNVTTVRNFSNKPIITERKVDIKEKIDIEKLLEGGGLNADGKKRPCNCTRSQCLKLYCECFANGEFCKGCNCKECYNSLEHEEDRQKAIRLCLDRNPNAFRPKIGKFNEEDAIRRQHNKGCNCKRSGCLKNYCECYEAKISCSSNCKCFGCRNVEGYFPRSDQISPQAAGVKRRQSEELEPQQCTPKKQACNFMTPDVVEASIQCMIAQADDCQKSSIPFLLTEKMILEEFGRCLAEIIDFSFNTDY